MSDNFLNGKINFDLDAPVVIERKTIKDFEKELYGIYEAYESTIKTYFDDRTSFNYSRFRQDFDPSVFLESFEYDYQQLVALDKKIGFLSYEQEGIVYTLYHIDDMSKSLNGLTEDTSVPPLQKILSWLNRILRDYIAAIDVTIPKLESAKQLILEKAKLSVFENSEASAFRSQEDLIDALFKLLKDMELAEENTTGERPDYKYLFTGKVREAYTIWYKWREHHYMTLDRFCSDYVRVDKKGKVVPLNGSAMKSHSATTALEHELKDKLDDFFSSVHI